jgi:tetratricopeptide (TPR) repeat protein
VTPILLALAAVQAAPQADAAAEARYRACAALVRSNAEQALSVAGAWRAEGGGFHARQCLGLAYVALERWAQAAGNYEEAARDADAARDPRRADLWVQAGNAWLAAGEPTRAVQALDSALATADLTEALRGEAHLDRARALVALGNAEGARADLDRALQLVADDPMAWYLSAELARRAGDLTRARADVGRAMTLAPDHPGVVLLAGTLAGLAGDMTEAERLYRRVAEGAPDSEAGRQARASLATLREIEVDAPTAPPQAPPPAT